MRKPHPGHAKKVERAIKVYRMRQTGMTYRAIGEHFGFSATRAQQVVVVGRKYVERGLDRSDREAIGL